MDPTTESLLAAAAAALSSTQDVEEASEMSDDQDGRYLLKRNATLDDYETAREKHRAQIIDGDLWLFAPASSDHQNAALQLSTILAPAHQQESETGWIILPEINLRLGPNQVYSPDLAGWRRTRMPRRPNVTYFDLTPDWVCEVLSRSTQRFDKGRKREEYARAGVQHMWLVDTAYKAIDVLRLFNGNYHLDETAAEDDNVVLPPFEFELDLRRLWAR